MKTINFYVEEIFKQIFTKESLLKNRWHLHIPIGILIYGTIFLLITILPNNGLNQATIHLLSTILCFIGVSIFEFSQQGGRIIEQKERIESNKDALVSVPTILLIIIVLGLIKKTWK